MGLNRRVAALAVSGTRVLVVEAPGWWTVRADVEREVRQRGWSLALSPADADALVVCGRPGERLGAAIEAVWDQLPGPRAREAVAGAGALGALDRVGAALLDHDGQRADAVGRQQRPPPPDDDGAGSDMDGMDMSGDGGDMGMDGMDMAPDGIELAGGFEGDRDALEMDVLHVTLGPVLPAWPAGVVLHATLSGDVLVEAEFDVLDDDLPPADGDEPDRPAVPAGSALVAARGCDRAVALLLLAGCDDLALGLQRVRDDLLAGAAPVDVGSTLERLVRRVSRSRLLRWSLRGLGGLDDAALEHHHLPARCRGDVHDRLLALLEGCLDAVREPSTAEVVDDAGVAARARAALPALVTGYELAAARLVLASLPLDAALPATPPVGAGRPCADGAGSATGTGPAGDAP